ncbi:MAG: TldD/PmbA family protein [Chloroflexi bacterium]|nr:TldD/PmbA family protein [Chloroflexota bacterium]
MTPAALLEQARRVAQAAEIYAYSNLETSASFEANRLKQLNTRQTQGFSLRLIVDGRIGFANASGTGGQGLVEAALETAPFGNRAHFQLPPAQAHPRVSTWDSKVEKFTVEAMAALGQSMVDQVRQHSPEVMVDAGIIKNAATIELLNTAGLRARYRKTTFSLYLEGTLIRGTDMLFVGDGESACRLIPDGRQVVEATILQLERAKRQAPAPKGKVPVLFSPRGVAAALVMPLMSAFNGRTVLQGASPLGHRLGERVFDRRLSLWDDATVAHRPGSRPWDEEGVPSQRTPLIQDGVVANFIYDLQTAGQARAKSTGNASRMGGGLLPTPNASALVIAPGKVTTAQMLKGIKEGLLVERLIGAGQGNILGGDFGGNVLLGYRVEGGQVVGRVKDTMISGNVYEALKEMAALGDQPEWVGGMLHTPPILCHSVSVSSKG